MKVYSKFKKKGAGIRYIVYDDGGVISDATFLEEAESIFNDIYNKEGEYEDFEWNGDLVLVEEIKRVH